jgi:site-specific recombinase XerD
MAPRTHEAYIGAVYRLARHYKKSPDQISDEELKNYVFHLASDRKLSASSLNQNVSAFRLFYETVLQRSMEQVRRALPRVTEPFIVRRFLASKSWNNYLPWAVPFPNTGRF